MKSKVINIKVDKMDCPSCATNLEIDLEELKGVNLAKASFVNETVKVDFDPELISEQTIQDQIKKTQEQ